jgi:hypothetical protein
MALTITQQQKNKDVVISQLLMQYNIVLSLYFMVQADGMAAIG